MYNINKGSASNPHAMDILRRLFWLSAIYGFHLTARHIPGSQNITSDRLSRLHDAGNKTWLLEHWHVGELQNHLFPDSLIYLQECWTDRPTNWTTKLLYSQSTIIYRLTFNPAFWCACLVAFYSSLRNQRHYPETCRDYNYQQTAMYKRSSLPRPGCDADHNYWPSPDNEPYPSFCQKCQSRPSARSTLRFES